jgi:hypothetical protein
VEKEIISDLCVGSGGSSFAQPIEQLMATAGELLNSRLYKQTLSLLVDAYSKSRRRHLPLDFDARYAFALRTALGIENLFNQIYNNLEDGMLQMKQQVLFSVY